MSNSICRATLLLILLGRFSLCSQPTGPAGDVPRLRISSDFPGGSAKVLGIDQDNNTVYLKTGEQLGRSINLYLQATNRPSAGK